MISVLDSPEIELVDTDFHAFNCAVWDRLCADSALAALDYRIETDRHGQIIMSPPPAPSHGNMLAEIGGMLRSISNNGTALCVCPISTREGVKAPDVAWCSDQLWSKYGDRTCFTEAPEICVEILSPSNTKGEIEEKKSLYFAGGAKEVWICDRDGAMYFFGSPEEEAGSERSALVPEFPGRIV